MIYEVLLLAQTRTALVRDFRGFGLGVGLWLRLEFNSLFRLGRLRLFINLLALLSRLLELLAFSLPLFILTLVLG